jgi:hypothetical protein
VAVAAGAASAVLAYLVPNNATFLNDQAELAALSRLHAGVNYRSDITAGLELGRAVAALVIARARGDGSDAVFTGPIPTGSCNWKGTNPAEPIAGTWRTWVLTSGSELRPAPPPACGSEQFLKELAEVVQGRTRRDEVFARYGGEEFLIVLPHSTVKAATEQAQRLCEQVRSLSVPVDDRTISVTISLGIAQYRVQKEDWQTLLSRADRALYQAKHNGRDQWFIDE